MRISINKKLSRDNVKVISGWELVQTTNLTEIERLLKNYSYSNFILKDKDTLRNKSNINSYNSYLIYDVDNDADDEQMTLKQCQERLKQLNLTFITLTSASHQKLKNDRIVDRFRVFIFIKNPINFTNDLKQVEIDKTSYYHELQTIIAKKLGLYESVDHSALKDVARQYFSSKSDSKFFVNRAELLDITSFKSLAITNLINNKLQKTKALTNGFKDLNLNREKGAEQNFINEFDKTKFVNVNYDYFFENVGFEDCLKYLNIDFKTEFGGDYLYIYFNNYKTALIKNSVVFNFHTQKNYNTTNLILDCGYKSLSSFFFKLLKNDAYQLLNLNKEELFIVNTELVESTLKTALKSVKSDLELSNYLKAVLGVNYVRIDTKQDDFLIIKDFAFNNSNLSVKKADIVNSLINNRKPKINGFGLR